jgi:hypothetical protein
MKRIFIVFGLALMACATLTQLGRNAASTALPTNTPEESKPTEQAIVTPSGTVIYVAPVCTILDEEDTRVEAYGNMFELAWGWKAMTEQQVRDYLESAVTRVTFNGEEVTDLEQTSIYESEGAYHVDWWKILGVLDRGKYAMTFFETYETKIFDGWDYFGPGTDNESTEDTCYLIVE